MKRLTKSGFRRLQREYLEDQPKSWKSCLISYLELIMLFDEIYVLWRENARLRWFVRSIARRECECSDQIDEQIFLPGGSSHTTCKITACDVCRARGALKKEE